MNRRTSLGVTCAVAAATLTIGGGAVFSSAPAAAAAAESCPAPGDMPDIDNGGPTFTDNNIAVYAGGDYVARDSAAESEGLLVVAGNATIDKSSGVFNVGSVGVGSGITPEGGENMFVVGGDLTVRSGTRIDVGAGVEGGGAVTVGGTATGTIDTNGASLTTGVGAESALEPYAGFGEQIVSASQQLGAADVTGTTETSGAVVNFIGTAGADPQVFEITADQMSAGKEFHFNDVPDGTAIVVNVTGGPVVATAPYWMGFDGTRLDDPGANGLGDAASRVLWNVTDATDVTIGGSSQFLGSILAPEGGVEITASTNGRVYVGHDLTTRGSGNEQHNYPWIGGLGFDCQSEIDPPATDADAADADAADADAADADATDATDADTTDAADADAADADTTDADATDAADADAADADATDAADADATDAADADAADAADADAADADATDADTTDAADADATDADAADADATDAADADATDSDATDADAADGADGLDAADADTVDADMTDADTTDADTTDADMTDADTTDADTADADMTDADTGDADADGGDAAGDSTGQDAAGSDAAGDATDADTTDGTAADATDNGDDLAVTGSTVPWAALGGAAVLMAAGVLLAARRVRRS